MFYNQLTAWQPYAMVIEAKQMLCSENDISLIRNVKSREETSASEERQIVQERERERKYGRERERAKEGESE